MSDFINVNFMPWLTPYQNIALGKITFWNYSRESEERINNSKIRKRLEEHFKSYKDITGSTNSIAIYSFEGKTFYDSLNEEEFNQLQEAVTTLAFASTTGKIEKRIQENQKHYMPPSMNAFDLMYRRLDFNSNRYAHLSLTVRDFGLEEGHIVFQKPFGTRDEAWISSKWLKYMNAYLALKNSSTLRNRISRSLEFYRLAQAQDDLKDNLLDSTFFTRTVLLVTAFESLLNFPILGKADFFANYAGD
jgi:hypothetical protein